MKIKNICESNCFFNGIVDGNTAVRADGRFNALFSNLRVGFRFPEMKSIVLNEEKPGGYGVFDRILVTESMVNEDSYKAHVQNGLFPY